MKQHFFIFLGLIAMLAAMPLSALGDSVIITNPLPNCEDLSCPLGLFLNFLWIIVTPVAAIAIVMGAFQFLTAGGDVEKVKKGKKTITYAVIGLFIVLISTSIQFVVKDLLSPSPPAIETPTPDTAPPPPPPVPECGNGVKEVTEACDLGSSSNGPCPSTCSSSCLLNTCTLPQCSDSIDNDEDGFTDSFDPECRGPSDNSELVY